MNKPDPDFHVGEVEAQSRWNTSKEWNSERRKQLLWTEIPVEFRERFEQAPYFFLATSNPDGECDCSFKGGGEGLIRLLDSRTFAFPDFDGNGAFMSIGNILLNPNVGCLFIDFTDGARLRVNGRAEILTGEACTRLFPKAPRTIRVHIEQVIPNCNRFIPLMKTA